MLTNARCSPKGAHLTMFALMNMETSLALMPRVLMLTTSNAALSEYYFFNLNSSSDVPLGEFMHFGFVICRCSGCLSML